MTDQEVQRLTKRALVNRSEYMLDLMLAAHTPAEAHRLYLEGYYYGHCAHPEDEKFSITDWDKVP